MDKVELDATTASVTNDYKLTSATDDTVTVGATDTAIVTAIQTFLSGAPASLGTLGADPTVGIYGIETGQSTYKLTFNKNLPNPSSDLTGTNYGIFLKILLVINLLKH